MGTHPQSTGRAAWLPYVLVGMSMLLFTGNTLTGRAMHEEIPPMALVFWRQIGAMVLLAPFVHGELRRKWPLLRQHWRLIAIVGVTQVVTGQAMIYAGLQTTTAINTGVIGTTQAPLILVVAWLLFGSKVSLRQSSGLILAIGGVLAIVSRGSLGVLLELDFVLGDLLVQLYAGELLLTGTGTGERVFLHDSGHDRVRCRGAAGRSAGDLSHRRPGAGDDRRVSRERATTGEGLSMVDRATLSSEPLARFGLSGTRR